MTETPYESWKDDFRSQSLPTDEPEVDPAALPAESADPEVPPERTCFYGIRAAREVLEPEELETTTWIQSAKRQAITPA